MCRYYRYPYFLGAVVSLRSRAKLSVEKAPGIESVCVRHVLQRDEEFTRRGTGI